MLIFLSKIHQPFLQVGSFLLLSFLLACGGGGGGEPSKQQQIALQFATANLTVFVDSNTLTNALSGGSGSGVVTYTSSNSQVANIDPTSGEISVQSAGEATISVTKAADETYNSATATFLLTVNKYEQQVLEVANNQVSVLMNDNNFSNPVSGGSGEGVLSFASADPLIVSVNADSGEMSIISPGETTITVTKAADETYKIASTSFIVIVNKREQTILEFALPVVSGFIDGLDLVNELTGGSGTGEINYSSSNELIAKVNATTGSLSLISAGDATITATKAGDEVYNETSANFTVTSILIAKGIEISVGLNDTEMKWQEQSGVIEVFRTTDETCDLSAYLDCADSNLTTVNDVTVLPLIDNFVNAEQSAFITLRNTTYISQALNTQLVPSPFKGRIGTAMYSFQNKLWIIGGKDDSSTIPIWYNDIWSSNDGIHWVQELEHAAFPGKEGHRVVELNQELYLIGGGQATENGGERWRLDVWKSTDGVVWQLIADPAPITGLANNSVMVFNNKIWNIGGSSFSGNTSIWSSVDGINWVEENSQVPFGPIGDHFSYLFDGKMWLSGGYGESGSIEPKDDIWSTTDGIEWILEADSTAFGARIEAHVVTLGDRLILTGGHSFAPGHNDSYSSTDGINWTLLASPIVPNMGQTHAAAIFNDQIWLFPSLSNGYLWRSDDAILWRAPLNMDIDWQTIP